MMSHPNCLDLSTNNPIIRRALPSYLHCDCSKVRMVVHGKKLLVLDVNGLLLATYSGGLKRPDRPHDARVKKYRVYKRPGCEEFLQFCLDNFIVGIWSSAHYIFKDVSDREAKDKLAFVWYQLHCTSTKFRHPENKSRQVFLKELSKLWGKSEPSLPWEIGDFGPSNTVLIDDSPHKALRNPLYTAIFPESYKATDVDDNFLGGELRTYLEGLAVAADVRVYLKKHPFGKPSISPNDLLVHCPRNSITQRSADIRTIEEHGSNVATCTEDVKNDKHQLPLIEQENASRLVQDNEILKMDELAND